MVWAVKRRFFYDVKTENKGRKQLEGYFAIDVL